MAQDPIWMSTARASCPTGRALREKPTLVLLHGGPGFDHALFKPAFSALADIAQVIYDAAPRATQAVPQLRPDAVPRRPGTGVTMMREFILE